MKHTYYFGFMSDLKKNGAAAAARHAREMGFDSVEYLDGKNPSISPEDAPKIRRELETAGITAACYSVGLQLYGDSSAEDALMRHAELCALLGSPYLHHTLILTPPADDPPRDAALDAVAEQAIRVADYAKTLGVTVLYENRGFYANGIDGFGRFCRQVRAHCKSVGVCADIGNILYACEKPVPFIDEYAREIRHVHLKDYLHADAAQDGWRRIADGTCLFPCALGDGVVGVADCIAALSRIGYDGALGYEIETVPIEDALTRSRSYISSLLAHEIPFYS